MKISEINYEVNKMAKYDKEFKINYDKITIKKEFFDNLSRTKTANYDWGYDRLTTNGISIDGEDFIKIAKVYALTAADIVLVLLYNDIDVKIDIDFISPRATFKSEQELQAFMRDIKENVRLLKEAK